MKIKKRHARRRPATPRPGVNATTRMAVCPVCRHWFEADGHGQTVWHRDEVDAAKVCPGSGQPALPPLDLKNKPLVFKKGLRK